MSIVSLFSLSKPFTNLLALKLVDDGVFQLDTPISMYLPAFESVKVHSDDKQPAPKTRQILISDLLRHTAGLSQSSDLQGWGPIAEYYRENDIFGLNCLAGSSSENLSQSVLRLTQAPLQTNPGERFSYSVATDVLGRVMEVATGKTFEALLTNYIAVPLGIDTLTTTVSKSNVERVVQLYEPMIKTYPVPGAYQRYQPFSKFEVDVINAGIQPGCVSPGSGLTASVDNLVTFVSFLLNDLRFADGSPFLSDSMLPLVFSGQLGKELGKSPMRRSIAYSRQDNLSMASLAIRTAKKGDLANAEDHDFYYWSGFSGSGLWIDKKTKTAGVLITQLYPSDRFLIPKLINETRANLK
jgi:CubicO group peptidase (beta-lactamase class C family)